MVRNIEMSNSSDDRSKDKMNDEQWQKDISRLKESSKVDDVSKKLNDLTNRTDRDKEELHQNIREISDDIKRLNADVAQRKWLNPGILINIGLVLLGTLLIAFYHFTVRIDGVGIRIDNVSGRMDRVYREHDYCSAQ